MKIKETMALATLLCTGIACTPATDIVIEGTLKNVPDSTIISLFRWEGDTGECIAYDTLIGGRFSITVQASDKEEKLGLDGRGIEFPPMELRLWGKPGARFHVTGDNTLVYTWRVKSNVPAQKTNQLFIEDSRALWDDFQRTLLAEMDYSRQAADLPQEERKALIEKRDSCDRAGEAIQLQIHGNIVQRLKQLPVDRVWLEHLHQVAIAVKFVPDHPYKEEVIALYNKLDETWKQHELAQNIQTYLFPPAIVKVGDEMADSDIYDLQGNIHHLAELKGRYILLDFWSCGCGPCVSSLPEMKEVAEQYADKLHIVSLSTDAENVWKKASEKHVLSGFNWNDLKGRNGLWAKYDVRGLPCYVLIAPDGRIADKWTGYGNGYLKQKLQQLMPKENQ